MDLQLIGIIVVALCGVSLIYTEVQKRLVFAKYERLFGQGDFEGCVRLLARPLVRFSLKPSSGWAKISCPMAMISSFRASIRSRHWALSASFVMLVLLRAAFGICGINRCFLENILYKNALRLFGKKTDIFGFKF